MNLPDKVADIEFLRINRNMRKICTCEQKTFEVDVNNRAVWCRKCGAWIDPFDAMVYFAKNLEQYQRDAQYYLNRAKEYYNYKPHLKIMKRLEEGYRQQNYSMFPVCPECKKPFDLANIDTWVNKKYVKKETVEK